MTTLGDDEVVLQADPDASERRGTPFDPFRVEVESRLHREHHAGLEGARRTSSRVVAGVVHLEPQPVRGLMGKEWLVGSGLEQLRHATLENPQIQESLRQHPTGGVVERADANTRAGRLDRRGPRGVHELVDITLGRAEATAGRVGSRNISMIHPHLGPRVDQNQVGLPDPTGVVDVVEHAAVGATSHDRIKARTRRPPDAERGFDGSLHDPFTRARPHFPGASPMTLDRDGARVTDGRQLVRILHDAEIVEDLARIHDRSGAAAHPPTAGSGTSQPFEHQAVDIASATQSIEDPTPRGQMLREAGGQLGEGVTRVGPGRLGRSLGAHPRPVPQLGLRVTLSDEEHEPRLGATDEHCDRAGLGQPGQVVELPIRRVRPQGIGHGELDRPRGKDHDAVVECFEDSAAALAEYVIGNRSRRIEVHARKVARRPAEGDGRHGRRSLSCDADSEDDRYRTDAEDLVTLSYRAATLWLVLLTLPGTRLAAQESDPDSVYQIEPIMVRVLGSTIGTATPYPVSVIAGPELTRGTAPAFIEDAVRAIPGVQIQNRYNLAVGERISVRGSGPRAQFGVRGIRVLVDGIPATLPDGQATLDHLDLAGLGRVEAVRGPAAAAYGNAAGGVLHFRTIDPSSVPASVSARSTTGSNGLWTVQSHATGTSGDVRYRIAASRMSFDGFRRDPIADNGSTYGEGTRSVFNGTLAVPLAGGELRVVGNAVDLDAENPGSLPIDVFDEGDRAAWGFNIVSGARKEVQQGQIGSTWTGDVGEQQLELAAWGIYRSLFNPIPGQIIDLSRGAGGARGLFQGTTTLGSASLGWRAGAEVELQRDDRKNFDSDGGEPDGLTLDQDERVTSVGLFVQSRLDVGESLSLLGGLRFDNVRFSATDRFFGGGDPDDSGERTMDAFSPSVGAVYRATDRVELFASVSRSFETPTTTELVNRPTGPGGFNPDLEPQKGVTYEGGVRGRLAERAALEASVFTTELTDGLVPFEVASDPGRTFFRNAGSAQHTGVEVSAGGEIVRDLSFRVAYTWIDAEFETFETEAGSFAGNKVPGLAPQRLDGLVSLTPGPLFVEVRARWQDDVPVDDAGTSEAPSYTLLDVRVGLSRYPVGNVSVSPFFNVSNLTDEAYVASVVPNAFGDRFFEPGPARTYQIGLGVTWGG